MFGHKLVSARVGQVMTTLFEKVQKSPLTDYGLVVLLFYLQEASAQ